MTRNSLLIFFAAAGISAAPVWAASAAIGVATAVNAFSVNNSLVTGSTNILDGAEVRTTTAPSDVHLQNGVTVHLATRSVGTVYNDHLVLREGAARVDNFDEYTVQAGQLQVQAETPGTHGVVRLEGKKLEVASIGGTIRVTDGGAMLTRVTAGTKLAFQQTGAAPIAPEKGPFPEKKVMFWTATVCIVSAGIVGGIAASQGKSPF